jgi:cellulose synthase/poly-beta-1,6-N-acetylglucosamine synthase-like glycosyltransferase
MISILIASMFEEKTIGKAIETFIAGYNGEFEILVSIPDEATFNAALTKCRELGIDSKLRRSTLDLGGKPQGKPFELNHLMTMAKGDIWFFGDGDTYFGDNVINKLIKHFDNPEVMAVTGRPVSADAKDNMMAYFGHLLADAAHHKRTVDLTTDAHGRSLSLIKKRPFFPVSGYLFAMRASDIRAPQDCLVEDAYFSYLIHNRGGKIDYEPSAIVYVKYPQNLHDYFKQKKRSAGGYVQLWQYGIVKPGTKTRSLWRELEYFWFPFKYAQNIRQLIWSLALYPVRLWLWIVIYWERKVIKKDFSKTWVRIESTK